MKIRSLSIICNLKPKSRLGRCLVLCVVWGGGKSGSCSFLLVVQSVTPTLRLLHNITTAAQNAAYNDKPTQTNPVHLTTGQCMQNVVKIFIILLFSIKLFDNEARLLGLCKDSTTGAPWLAGALGPGLVGLGGNPALVVGHVKVEQSPLVLLECMVMHVFISI